MSGTYRHVGPEMRDRITGMLQADWEAALDERLALSHGSTAAVLDRLLKERLEARKLRLVDGTGPDFSRDPPGTPEGVSLGEGNRL